MPIFSPDGTEYEAMLQITTSSLESERLSIEAWTLNKDQLSSIKDLLGEPNAELTQSMQNATDEMMRRDGLI